MTANGLHLAELELDPAAPAIATGERVIYLLHYERPYRHARHYIGSTTDLERRLREHREGQRHAGRLPQVFHEQGIGFELVRLWRGSRTIERTIKRRGGASRICPVCRGGAS